MGKIGLQLYTLRDEASRDFLGTIRRTAQIGYQGIEFAGFFGTPARVLKDTLDEAGLEAAGVVVDWAVLEKGLEASIEYCKLIGSSTILCPWIDESKRQSLNDFKNITQQFRRFGLMCRESGLRLLHHIHGFEFIRIGDTCLMDYLFENSDPTWLDFEIDVYWVEHAGVDAVEFMRLHGSRCPYIHFKDTKSKTKFYDTEVGEGVIDMPSIMKWGKHYGAEWFIVEQEAFDITPYKSVEISLRNLQKMDSQN